MNEQKKISTQYVIYRLLTNMWFVGAVWLYFYRLFITDQQIGILDGAAFAIGLLAEVPSGALADKFGRGRLMRLGQFLAGSGLLIQAFGTSFIPLFVGQTIMMIGVAFASGADEALFFGKLQFKRESVDWRKLVTRGSQAAMVGSLFATVIGGYLHIIDPRIPWILTGLSFIGAMLVVWNLEDKRSLSVSKKIREEFLDYVDNIKIGFSQFALPKLWLYVPIILTVQGLFYTAGWGVLRLILLDRFYFDPFLGAIAVGSCSLVTVGVLAYVHKHAESLSEKRVLVLISLAAVASLLLSLADIGYWGYVVILMLYVGEHILHPFMSEILNYQAPEETRATILSVASFMRMLPYVVLAPIIGYLSTEDRLEYFFVFWAILTCLAVLFYLSKKKGDKTISLVQEAG